MKDKPSILIKVVSVLLTIVVVALICVAVGMSLTFLTGVTWSWHLVLFIALWTLIIDLIITSFTKRKKG